ncbi:LVIVD repeat-containing protein [Planotetraspora sp. GP83]|uniref:LVIVD repeat-containing protein n=1 Tax=Planotetraspora sp. GP83 TaxID=3156264 RepID=UPI0035156550
MGLVSLAAVVLLAACSAGVEEPATRTRASARPSGTVPSEKVLHSDNLRLVANVPLDAPFDGPESWGTDLAFQGNYAFVGNYDGFTVFDISDPEKPFVLTRVLCPAGQNDISVYGNLLFLSVDEPRAGEGCESGRGDPSLETSWEGIRIFDISDVGNPRYVKAVRTECGSHTHALIPGPDIDYLYVSSPGPIPDTANCGPPHEMISIVEVPVNDPAAARVAATPTLFQGRDAGKFGGCHDMTVYPEKKLAAGACYGDGILLDIADPLRPKVLQQVSDHQNFSVWHSATFNNDGTKVVFTDELGGGQSPMCTAEIPHNKGGDAIYEITADRKLVRLGLYKIPRVQSDTENCVAHNGSLVPVHGKDILVQAWYQGGVSVWDFTDPAAASEIAYFDREALPGAHALGGSWSAYYYNGYIYSSDITKGLDVLKVTDPRTDPADDIHLKGLNAQTQESY